jgi:hypothetical protein
MNCTLNGETEGAVPCPQARKAALRILSRARKQADSRRRVRSLTVAGSNFFTDSYAPGSDVLPPPWQDPSVNAVGPSGLRL